MYLSINMLNKRLIIVGGSVTIALVFVAFIIAMVGGLQAQVSWEKKAQRHVIAKGLVSAVQKMAKSSGVSDSIRQHVPGHYGDLYSMHVASSGKLTIGVAQDLDHPGMAVVAWQDPLVDTTTFYKANLKLSPNGKLSELEKTVSSELKSIKSGSKTGIYGYHGSDGGGPYRTRVIGTRGAKGVIALTVNKDYSRIALTGQFPTNESQPESWLWRGDIAEHKAVSLHKTEPAYPIDPYL